MKFLIGMKEKELKRNDKMVFNKKEYYHRKEEKSKTVSKCGCKH